MPRCGRMRISRVVVQMAVDDSRMNAGRVRRCAGLLARGAEVNVTDASGSTPLMQAAYNETGDPTIVNRFLALGADPNVKNKNGETALTWAMRRETLDTVWGGGASDALEAREAIRAVGNEAGESVRERPRCPR